jgi:hypothetical protein
MAQGTSGALSCTHDRSPGRTSHLHVHGADLCHSVQCGAPPRRPGAWRTAFWARIQKQLITSRPHPCMRKGKHNQRAEGRLEAFRGRKGLGPVAIWTGPKRRRVFAEAHHLLCHARLGEVRLLPVSHLMDRVGEGVCYRFAPFTISNRKHTSQTHSSCVLTTAADR